MNTLYVSIITDLLAPFCADGHRKWTPSPMRHNGYIYAASGHMGIRVKSDDTSLPTLLDELAKQYNAAIKPPENVRPIADVHQARAAFLVMCKTCGGTNTAPRDKQDESGDCIACGGKGISIAGVIDTIDGVDLPVRCTNAMRRFSSLQVGRMNDGYSLYFRAHGGVDGVIASIKIDWLNRIRTESLVFMPVPR